jgi:hypothetical protein
MNEQNEVIYEHNQKKNSHQNPKAKLKTSSTVQAVKTISSRYLALFHRAEMSTMDVEHTLHGGELSHESRNKMVYHNTPRGLSLTNFLSLEASPSFSTVESRPSPPGPI